MSWVNPTSHSTTGCVMDLGAEFPERAYDDDLATFCNMGEDVQCEWCIVAFFRSAIQSDKVRFYLSLFSGGADQFIVRVRKGGVWEQVYLSDSPPINQWVECPFTEGSVDAMDVRIHRAAAAGLPIPVRLCEVDFWQLPPPAVGYQYGDGLVTIQA